MLTNTTLSQYAMSVLETKITDDSPTNSLHEYNFVVEFIEALETIEQADDFIGCPWNDLTESPDFEQFVVDMANMFGYLYHTGRIPNSKIVELITEELDSRIEEAGLVW